MVREWLKNLRGRSAKDSASDDARRERRMDSERVDRSAGRVMGVYGDLGPTVPGPETAEDPAPRD
jgi:hypothetical protein